MANISQVFMIQEENEKGIIGNDISEQELISVDILGKEGKL